MTLSLFFASFRSTICNAIKSNSRKRIFNCMKDVAQNSHMRQYILAFSHEIADIICDVLKTIPGYDWTFVPSLNPDNLWKFKILFFQNGAFDGTICREIMNVSLPPDDELSKEVNETLGLFRCAVIDTIQTMRLTKSCFENVLERRLTKSQIKMVLLLWPSIINVIYDIAMEYMRSTYRPNLNFRMNREGEKLKISINFSV